MKSKKLLILLPIIVLSSCSSSLGKEISSDEASNIESAIFEKQRNTNAYSFSYQIVTTINGSKETINYKYIHEENGNYMISREEKDNSNNSSYRSSKAIYVFSQTEKEKVLYIKTYNAKTNKYDIQSYTKFGKDALFEDALSKQASFSKEVTSYYKSFYESFTGQYFYSKGEGDLTIKHSSRFKEEVASEAYTTAEFTYRYSDYLFSSYTATYKASDGSKRNETAKGSYSNVKVNIPSDWEEYVIETTIV